ncbi:MAG: hypothetical protein Kow0089_21930 [Desulfobulbaceae bacterium]
MSATRFAGVINGIPLLVLLFALVLSGGCGKGDSPEEQVRRFVAAGEEAVENRSIGDVRNLISEEYGDDQGRTRRDLVALTARYLYANKNIHILTRIDELRFPEPDRAVLVLFAAMTGQNVSDLDSLLNTQADLYRFDLVLRKEEGEWKLLQADWRRARAEEFF